MADDFSFQGKPIDEFHMKMVGMGAYPCRDASGDKPLHIDDIVSLHFEGRVKNVHFDTDKDGRLIAVALISPIDIAFQPWDASDPQDDGVARGNRIIAP